MVSKYSFLALPNVKVKVDGKINLRAVSESLKLKVSSGRSTFRGELLRSKFSKKLTEFFEQVEESLKERLELVHWSRIQDSFEKALSIQNRMKELDKAIRYLTLKRGLTISLTDRLTKYPSSQYPRIKLMKDLFGKFSEYIFVNKKSLDLSNTKKLSEILFDDSNYLIRVYLDPGALSWKVLDTDLFFMLFRIYQLTPTKLYQIFGRGRKYTKSQINSFKIECYSVIKEFFFSNPYSSLYVSDKVRSYPTGSKTGVRNVHVGVNHFELEFDMIWSVWYAYVEQYVARFPSVNREIFPPGSKFNKLFGQRFMDTVLGSTPFKRKAISDRFKGGVHFSKDSVEFFRDILRLFQTFGLKPSTAPHHHAVENAINFAEEYLVKRYPTRVSPSFYPGPTEDFFVDLKNPNLLTLPEALLNQLREANVLSGHFSFSAQAYKLRHPNDYHSCSDFYKEINIGHDPVDKQKKRDFILNRLTSSYNSIFRKMTLNKDLSKSGMPILKVDSFSPGAPQPILDLIRLANDFNNEYILGIASDIERTKRGLGHPSHGGLQKEVISKLSQYLIANELPVWRKVGPKLVTGHIDILLKVGDTLFVCDYKPDGTGNPHTTRLKDSFIESIPQVASYAKILKKEYGVKKVVCITFNHNNEAWIYHDSLLGDLETWMTGMGISQYIIWKDYIY